MTALGPPRFLAIGDSYTIGEGVARGDGWPAQLVRRLHARGISLAEPEIIAKTGWTTDELGAAIDAATLHPPYALVTLLIGVNNQYRGRSTGDFAADLARLARRAITFAGADPSRVIMISIPDWGVTRFALEQGREPARIGAEIDVFNAIVRTFAQEHGLAFADVTGISRASFAPAMLVEDGLHPSVAQYALWADALVAPAERALASSVGAGAHRA